MSVVLCSSIYKCVDVLLELLQYLQYHECSIGILLVGEEEKITARPLVCPFTNVPNQCLGETMHTKQLYSQLQCEVPQYAKSFILSVLNKLSSYSYSYVYFFYIATYSYSFVIILYLNQLVYGCIVWFFSCSYIAACIAFLYSCIVCFVVKLCCPFVQLCYLFVQLCCLLQSHMEEQLCLISSVLLIANMESMKIITIPDNPLRITCVRTHAHLVSRGQTTIFAQGHFAVWPRETIMDITCTNL